MQADAASVGIRGFLVDAPVPGELRSVRDGALVIDPDGFIAERGEYTTLRNRPREHPVRWLQSRTAAIFPGLLDIHTHIPQYPAVGRGAGELLPWLREHIFPLEREFAGPRARSEAPAFFAEAARHGTTTVMAYTAIFEDSCDAAFAAAAKSGIRAILGKMMMDVGSYGKLAPHKVAAVSIAETERLIRRWHGKEDGRLEYAVSPRFALTCSMRLMSDAASLAKERGTYVQTHLSENVEELERVRHLFSDAADYTDVYDRAGLLGERTVLGHCIHLSDRERGVLAERGCVAAHCPTANLFLSSGILPLDRMRAAGIRVGLGTDVAAGPELNLWRVMRCAIESQKARRFHDPLVRVPTPAEVLYLATQGAAEALGKGGTIGSLDVGKEADLAVMDVRALLPYRSGARAVDDLSAEDVLNLCIYRGGPDAVIETFVRGRSIWRAPEPELF